MNYIGILQTGDVDEAISKAEELVAQGRHIITHRYEYPLPERFFDESPYSLMFEHEPIEYEVYVDRDG